MNQIEKYNNTTFESIKHINEFGNEYWYARELMVALEYGKWGNFKKVIDKAKLACELSDNIVSDHFADVGKMIKMPKGATKEINDLIKPKLSSNLTSEQLDNKVRYLLRKLREEGKITNIGSDKSPKWIIQNKD